MSVRQEALQLASPVAGGRSVSDPGLTRGPGPNLRSPVDSNCYWCEVDGSCQMRSLTCLDFDSDCPWLKA